MNGRELAGRLQRLRLGPGVLYVPGYAGEAIARQGILDSAVHYLQKPFTMGSLLRKVREVLDSPAPHSGRRPARP
jgi:FixJ family two-component response regulator